MPYAGLYGVLAGTQAVRTRGHCVRRHQTHSKYGSSAYARASRLPDSNKQLFSALCHYLLFALEHKSAFYHLRSRIRPLRYSFTAPSFLELSKRGVFETEMERSRV